MVMFTIAAIYAPTTADVDVECSLQTVPWGSQAASRLRSSEAPTPRRTVAIGIAADGPPAAADVPAAVSLECRQRGRRFWPGVVLATLPLQAHLTAPRRRLQGVDVVRLLIVLQGPPDAVSPRRDDGFIGDFGSGSGGRGGHDWGGHRSRDPGSALLRVALMLEIADSVGWGGVLRLRRHG